MFTRVVQKEIKNMLFSIAEKHGLSYRTVEDIYFQQFEFLAKMMASGVKNDFSTYENILLKQFGTFIANEKHINKLKEINDAKQETNNEVGE